MKTSFYLVLVVVLHGLNLIFVFACVLLTLFFSVRALFPQTGLLQLQTLFKHLLKHLRAHAETQSDTSDLLPMPKVPDLSPDNWR